MHLCLIWVQLNGGGGRGCLIFSRNSVLTVKPKGGRYVYIDIPLPIKGFFKVVALSSDWPEGETQTRGNEEHSSF